MNASADRNLLFGILAVQAGFATERQLIDAMNAWTLAKHRPLGELLIERGLPADEHDLVAALVVKHLANHAGDAAAGLAGLSSATPVKVALAAVDDAEVQASLGATIDLPHGPRLAGGLSSSSPRYRIIKPHAKGGLGEVFLAEDGEIKRQVALKEIRSDRDADQGSVGRFVKEAEITGQLEHPGVVPIYGLGTYGDGRPYYAMRFIQGMELKQAIADFHQASGGRQSPESFVDQNSKSERLGGLSSPARRFATREFRDLLGRFNDVCNAVAYAHSRGVLHRDLKPGNIMLGKYGETLVVDWGLAKVVGRDDPASGEQTVQPSSGQSGETLPNSVLGTPQYMSPEQAAGRIADLGPATDVYALGAILHCILTGKPPIEPGPTPDILRRVKEGALLSAGDAPKPLAAVARKAMSLHPDARYRSALDLAAEVERWLADESVTAFDDPLPARAARWTRKHPATTAGAASVTLMLLLSLGIGLSVVSGYNQQLATAKYATDAKNRELDASNGKLTTSLAAEEVRSAQLEKATEALTGVFAKLDPKSEEKDMDGSKLRLLLGQNLGEVAKLLEGEAAGDFKATARMHSWLAAAYLGLGQADKAMPLYVETLARMKAKLGPDHPDSIVAEAELADNLLKQAKFAEAEPLLRHVVAIRGKATPDVWNTFNAKSLLGEALLGIGRHAEAESLLLSGHEELAKRRDKIPPQFRELRLHSAHLARPRRDTPDRHVVRMEERLHIHEPTAEGRAVGAGGHRPGRSAIRTLRPFGFADRIQFGRDGRATMAHDDFMKMKGAAA